jgi:hypothetical protein
MVVIDEKGRNFSKIWDKIPSGASISGQLFQNGILTSSG